MINSKAGVQNIKWTRLERNAIYKKKAEETKCDNGMSMKTNSPKSEEN